MCSIDQQSDMAVRLLQGALSLVQRYDVTSSLDLWHGFPATFDIASRAQAFLGTGTPARRTLLDC
jgi:hypothetical protein